MAHKGSYWLFGTHVLLLLTCLFHPRVARAWGDEGHRAIATVAYDRLTAASRQKVDAILAGEPITNAAVWPDKIRGGQHPGPLANTPEGKAFNKKFKNNSFWHYVDLPLGSKGYDQSPQFTSTNDIIHALTLCIDVLEGRNHSMSNLEALRWVCHLVGDVHQPVHVACGYFEFNDQGDPHLRTNPELIVAHDLLSGDDKGANRLRYTNTENLHHYWDAVLVNHAASPHQLLNDVLTSHIAQSHYRNRGNYRSWPVKWSKNSVAAARHAYQEIDFKDKLMDAGDWYISIDLPPGYQDSMVPVATDQLSRAAFNLAALLNKIRWP